MAKQQERVVRERPAARERPTSERYERYVGGSPEAERVILQRLADDLMRVQLKIKERGGASGIDRTFHAKAILGVENATLRFHDSLPQELRTGFAQPGAEYPVIIRLSNASGARRPDPAPDLRGAALRIQAGDGEAHDLLMTNHPVSHAANAREFVVFARVMAGADTTVRRALALYVRLPWALGWATAARMRRNVLAGARREVRSLALETYWSRSAILWGEAGPVRYRLRPAAVSPAVPAPPPWDADHLSHELAARLARQDIVFELCVQRYEDARLTPIENGAADWPDADVPVVPVATLTIPRQDLGTAAARAAAARIDQLAFDPWNTTDAFRPLGNLNRARKAAYKASSAHRRGRRFVTPTPRRNVVAGALLRGAFGALNRFVPWHRLPTWIGLLNVATIRQVLRRENLFDTEVRQAPPRPHPVPPALDESLLVRRTYDGTYNDLSDPAMGALGATFGRNLRPVHRPDLFDEPNPVVVSRELLHRDSFIPARSLNVIAAAWIQFQVHDWVDHKRCPAGAGSVEVPLPYGMTWTNTPGGAPERVMRFADNEDLRPAGGTGPPILSANAASHWWDGSEVYGGDESVAKSLREPDGDASLRLENGHLVPGPDGIPITGFRNNWWLGLSVMHTLFAREHNAVCRALREEYPGMDEESVYHTARLVVSALIAKIHTVEWTPAILATELIDIGLKANWQGPPKSWLTHLGLWLADAHALTGIPGTLPDHHGTPYSLTEDFVTVYRMHPLIPDDYELADHRTGRRLESLGFHDLQGAATEPVMRRTGLANALYSLGIAHPGAITLRNFPRALQAFEREGEIIDLSVVDLVRTRRRAVPRYNDFRAGLHRPRLRRFEDLTTNPDCLARLRDVYRSVDDIDTMVGLFAENPPERFGFSDTAFRIFILMASRRLQSDRFLTVDFRPEIYTPLGMDWVARNGMTSVILRHCPGLAAVLPRTTSAFAPWRPARPEANTGTTPD
ncbi:Catalase [[Actinomadura] parvosata subsp. kistnae]|uniref:peroxidase family protein n=1 Tax=[Actinomadura] parvosata TaxID=1955412 RepID=UPI0009AC65D9|nr:peroxidase family protein [Nonomuraea sp. ATCC 55076]SPL97289.1 Catalase [Actinomadura parvosata subsp. kistnae]